MNVLDTREARARMFARGFISSAASLKKYTFYRGAAELAEFGFNLELWQHYSTDFESDFPPGTPYPSSRKMIFIKSL